VFNKNYIMKDIYIFGASGYARETAFIIQELEFNIKAFIDIKSNDIEISINKFSYPIISEESFYNLCLNNNLYAVIAISDPKITEKIITRFQEICEFPNIIHPSSKIYGSYNIGVGNLISYNCIFTDNIKIGSFNRFNVGVAVGHDVDIGDNNQFNPSCNISGYVTIENNNFFGVNSVILQKVRIKNNTIVGASSLVLRNILKEGTYIGVPAKKIEF